MEVASITTAVTVVGFVCIWITLGFLSLFTVGWGRLVWRNLRRCYHLTVLAYWLRRLERGGWRVFQRAEMRDRATAHALGDGGAKG